MVDTFHNLTEEKIIRIYKLPYELLAMQEGKKRGLDIKVDMTVRKKDKARTS